MAMIHFQDYEEYVSAKNRLEELQKYRRAMAGQEEEVLGTAPEEKQRGRTELVMEDNTIYEIDTECEECLKTFWRWKAEEKAGQQ